MTQLLMPFDERAAYRQAVRHFRKSKRSLAATKRASTGGRAVRHARFCEKEDHKGLRIVLRWMTRYTEGGAK